MNHLFVPLFILAFFRLSRAEKHETDNLGASKIDFPDIKPYTVHIISEIDPSKGPQLRFHCQSFDNDLGVHYPKLNQDFNFTFRENIFKSTLFFCSFTRGVQNQSFDVFNPAISQKCRRCYWRVKADGFYFSDTGASDQYQKQYFWK